MHMCEAWGAYVGFCYGFSSQVGLVTWVGLRKPRVSFQISLNSQVVKEVQRDLQVSRAKQPLSFAKPD